MKNVVQKNEEQNVISDQAFKATALQYFSEALFKEEFENCSELIDIAKKFGAQPSDIKGVIAGYLRGDPAGGQNEVFQGKNRLFR